MVSALGGCFSFNAYYRHKRREKAKKSGGISNNNAKIPTYHDSFEVKSTKAKDRRQKTEDGRQKTEDRRQKTEVRSLIDSSTALGMTLKMINDN